MRITLPSIPEQPALHCALHTYLTLPSPLFLDRYPFADTLTLSSHNLKALHALAGATDLEAPDYLIPQWGSAALFEVAHPASSSTPSPFSFTIPLHLRYLQPTNSTPTGHQQVEVPDPVLFWACPASEYGKFPSSPFDRVNLGYEGLFGPKTLFYHFSPSASTSSPPNLAGVERKLVQQLSVPVLSLRSAWYVEWGTVAAVLCGALLVGWPLVRVLVREFARRWESFNAQSGEEVEKKRK